MRKAKIIQDSLGQWLVTEEIESGVIPVAGPYGTRNQAIDGAKALGFQNLWIDGGPDNVDMNRSGLASASDPFTNDYGDPVKTGMLGPS